MLSPVIARASDRYLSSKAVCSGKRRNYVAAMACLALLIIAAPYVGTLTELLVVLTLVLTGSTMGAGLNFSLASDLLGNPRDVSRVIAITALGGNFFGLIAPIITGYVVFGDRRLPVGVRHRGSPSDRRRDHDADDDAQTHCA